VKVWREVIGIKASEKKRLDDGDKKLNGSKKEAINNRLIVNFMESRSHHEAMKRRGDKRGDLTLGRQTERKKNQCFAATGQRD